ncbi:hypothetical protein GPECTOR_8g78 [Gonium pectorale]|uniref:Protein kinase domain-containing protein n=1 Tax=Gonium pectorale TaxID=33097 RepID=A0A150GT93_GONPE|nr:hypothetical protein GPECTOR_8g78 [Gonium pectorale]|eukprot:KXZ53086.1 hypothetical protein GPECTOR_8g78 [Gonium pectorale]
MQKRDVWRAHLQWAAFEDQYGIYLVFEYASKGDVFTEVERRGGQLNEAEAVRQVIFPFLSALEYLHGNCIIHRDIKPENLLFTATGVLKVGDFGLSINFSQERPVTRVGTLDYMAPEVVVCPDKHRPQDNKEMKHLQYTPLVDAWAVGVLAYELIIGRPPFDKGQKKATINEILNGEPFIPPWVSEGATHFIKWSLTKEQGKRPSVQQLSEHPWVVSHMKQGVMNTARRQLVKTDSFVEPRQLGFRGSNMPADSTPQPNSKEAPRPLQASSASVGGRFLGHSSSMSAMDGMRFRDIHLDSVTGGMAAAADEALSAVKRVSDGDGTTGGRPSAAGGRVSRAGTARNSGAGGLTRMNSLSSVAAAATAGAVAAAVAAADEAAKRPMTREELLASLTAPPGSRNLAVMRSFTSGRSSPGIQGHASPRQHQPARTSGSGGRSLSPAPSSPLARSGSVHDYHQHHPPGVGYQPGGGLLASPDLGLDMSRLRVDTAPSGPSSGGAPHSPKGVSQLRPQPPQAPSPTARGLKTGSPLIPSRLSQSFTSPVSPLASAGSITHQTGAPSRLGLPSNSGATNSSQSGAPPTVVAAAAAAAARHPHHNGAMPTSLDHAGGMYSSGGAAVSGGLHSPRHLQVSPLAPASPRGVSPRELPGERDDPEASPGDGASSSSISSGSIKKGLFGSFKKVFS